MNKKNVSLYVFLIIFYLPRIVNADVSYEVQIRERLGRCMHSAQKQSRIIEVKDSCSVKQKYICLVYATCTKDVISSNMVSSEVKPVEGQCFVEDGKCPIDPVECFAKKDLITVGLGQSIIATLRSDVSTSATVERTSTTTRPGRVKPSRLQGQAK